MRLPLFIASLAVACLLAGTADARTRNVTDADAPRSLPANGPVSVDWTDPNEFSDIRHSGNRWAAQRGNWVEQLARHLQARAATRLPQGERLEVTITDIMRAGQYEPWRGPNLQDARIVREIYPPRMSLTFKRLDANGAVIDEGARALRDFGFMMSASAGSSDPLRHEKRMIDDWIRREFRPHTGA
jgi:Protein of unknown function (DUF3016)